MSSSAPGDGIEGILEMRGVDLEAAILTILAPCQTHPEGEWSNGQGTFKMVIIDGHFLRELTIYEPPKSEGNPSRNHQNPPSYFTLYLVFA
jgi:hypothetical protein